LDNNGYVIGGLSFLMIIPAVILSIILINLINLDISTNTVLKSDTMFHISNDVERNIPILTRLSLKETAENVVKNTEPVSNSRITIKNDLQSKIDNLTRNYQENTGVTVYCEIKSVDSARDPFEVHVMSIISVQKGNVSYIRDICQNISYLDYNFSERLSIEVVKIPDPLPLIKTKKYGANVTGNRINYGSSLTKYLNSKGINGSFVYENASSPLYIKKCPFEPYNVHGNCNGFFNLKNCIDNGFYHESNDGACLLCRLEGKATCNHLGIETFIVPDKSTNYFLKGPSSPDHVIFSENGPYGYGTYSGNVFQYYSSGNVSYKLFLDNGHRLKYGIPVY
jgi:hypothetical protein